MLPAAHPHPEIPKVPPPPNGGLEESKVLKCLRRILEMRGSAGLYVTTNGTTSLEALGLVCKSDRSGVMHNPCKLSYKRLQKVTEDVVLPSLTEQTTHQLFSKRLSRLKYSTHCYAACALCQ